MADLDGAARLVQAAIDAFGGLDVVVNNAGFVRDRMFANAAEDEWDAVVRVHLKGHFAVARHAAAHWRDQAKAGTPVDARIINTSSGAGHPRLGRPGRLLRRQGRHRHAHPRAGRRAGPLRRDRQRPGPAARTRMTEGVFAEMMATPDGPDAFDAMAPENVSPLVAWLASTESAARHRPDVRGRGRQGRHRHRLAARPHRATRAPAGTPPSSAPVVDGLLAQAPDAAPVYGAS